MKKTILILFTLFCVNAFAEDSAPNPDDPNLRLPSSNPSDTAAVRSADKSKSHGTNVLAVTRKTGIEIQQKLLENKGETKEVNTIPKALAAQPVQVEKSHSFGGNMALDSYSSLLDLTPESDAKSSDNDVERTAQVIDSGAQ